MTKPQCGEISDDAERKAWSKQENISRVLVWPKDRTEERSTKHQTESTVTNITIIKQTSKKIGLLGDSMSNIVIICAGPNSISNEKQIKL